MDERASERFVQTLSFLFKDICALITPQTGNFSISLDDDRFTVLQQSIRKKSRSQLTQMETLQNIYCGSADFSS
jgi:hypothetical protein